MVNYNALHHAHHFSLRTSICNVLMGSCSLCLDRNAIIKKSESMFQKLSLFCMALLKMHCIQGQLKALTHEPGSNLFMDYML